LEKRTEDGTISVSIPGVIDISDSEVWDDIMGDYIYSKSKSGCKIVVDAIDSRLGVGKTSFAIGLALRIGEEVGYEIQTEDVMLSAQQFLKRFREHPGTEQPSIIILDEIVGAGGADSRRAMSNKNVNMARTFEIMRKKRVVVIMTTANYFGMDPRLRRLMDYVFTCQVSPKFHAVGYKVGTRFGTGDLRLRRMSERIRFYSLDGHPLLVELDNQKDRLLESEEFDMDKKIENERLEKGATEEERRLSAEREVYWAVIAYKYKPDKDGKKPTWKDCLKKCEQVSEYYYPFYNIPIPELHPTDEALRLWCHRKNTMYGNVQIQKDENGRGNEE